VLLQEVMGRGPRVGFFELSRMTKRTFSCWVWVSLCGGASDLISCLTSVVYGGIYPEHFVFGLLLALHHFGNVHRKLKCGHKMAAGKHIVCSAFCSCDDNRRVFVARGLRIRRHRRDMRRAGAYIEISSPMLTLTKSIHLSLSPTLTCLGPDLIITA
jgi:hypothetical protein